MNDTILVSVVMSVYNGERYLREAIDSILNQTFRNFEFIIINDGSTDDSLKIIKDYQRQDDRIVLISREKKGLSKSLNEGISIAKGEYIARMDADDISFPRRLEEQISFLNKNIGINILGTSSIWINSNNKYISSHLITLKPSQVKSHLLLDSCICHPSVMIERKVFDLYKYDENYPCAQDYKLWSDCSDRFQLSVISKPLLKYRVHNSNISVRHEKSQVETANKVRRENLRRTNLEETSIELIMSLYNQKNIDIVKYHNVVENIQDSYLLNRIKVSFLKYLIKNKLYYHIIRFVIVNHKFMRITLTQGFKDVVLGFYWRLLWKIN